MKFTTLKLKTPVDGDYTCYLAVEQVKELLEFVAFEKLELARCSRDDEYKDMMVADAAAYRLLSSSIDDYVC